jgi:type I restriction enzyme R subunit
VWRAYEAARPRKVRPRRAADCLADVISLVRFAVRKDDELAPFADGVRTRFSAWLEHCLAAGRAFTEEQLRWLALIRDHVAASAEIASDDFELSPFVEEGGLGRAVRLFGQEHLPALLEELNAEMAA